ncbi:aryl-sulfate sulfotransferase [Kaustia mangrovi]|uniref:Aryl-sulfate sulfotransferase n=1 Tax=Kaustia mangrovi TaxID=2593653 RepID=A0A7S8C1X3_9HYPH|nr:arylsulfotransferase family protein [Kaustia mangrovi]QPC41853.1 aryl-sulfate sulfotransferase [Kaustia mangrovi]
MAGSPGIAVSQDDKETAGGSAGERIGQAIFIAMIVFLAFVGGALVVLGKVFPYQVLHDAYAAGQALIAQREMTADKFGTDLWTKARGNASGVTAFDRQRAFGGYTLYTSGDAPAARLVSMTGEVVHEWRKSFSEVWDESSPVSSPQRDELTYMRKARLMPNGDLLAIYIAAGETPWGYGMVRLDKDSNVVWRYFGQTHHDFDVAPDGRVFALTHAFTSEPVKGFDALGKPRLDDFVVVLDGDGRETRKVSLTDALLSSPYAAFLYAIPSFSLGDPLHTNTVEYIDADKARVFPFGKEGDVLVSFRDMGVIAVVDMDEGKVTWATRGPWVGQHSPTILPDGHILMFDNLGNFEQGNSSRVIEFDPETMAVRWTYKGSADKPLDSAIRSGAQRLPNGNTLVTESNGSRLLEVTGDGNIVWEYINPVRDGEGGAYAPVVSWGRRIDPATLSPDFRATLTHEKEASR